MQPSLSYSPSLDAHINVPTLVCARLPETCLLFACIFTFFEHGRTPTNAEYMHHLRARYDLARAERIRHLALLEELEEARRALPKHKKFRAQRKRLDARIEGIKTALPEQGLDIQVLCRRDTDRGQEQVKLHTMHILGLAEVEDRESLTLVAARIRHGKFFTTASSLDELADRLGALEKEQSLPHLWRGLPALYASLFGLSYTHQLEHGLPPGTCYYARTRGEEGLYTSALLLEQCGYKRSYYARGKAMQLQIELLKRITISGTQGKHHFDGVPLLVEERTQVRARELPEGVRPGEWAMLHIPRAIWALQSEQFAQVPAALLRSHDLYTVNLGLILKAEEAYKHGQPHDSGYTLALERLIDQAGLRQVFRAHHSRDEAWLGRALGDLEAMGIVTKVEGKRLEPLSSEQLDTQLELSFDAPVPPQPQVAHARPTRMRQRLARRRFKKLLAHEKLCVHLYRRLLKSAPAEQGKEAAPSQQPLLSTG